MASLRPPSMWLAVVVITLACPFLTSAVHVLQTRELLSGRVRTPRARGGPFADRKVCHSVEPGYVQCYPDLMFIGESKAGTTSVSMYMLQHPQIVVQSLGDSGPYTHPVISTPNDTARKPMQYELHMFDQAFTTQWDSSPRIPKRSMDDYLQMHYTPNYIYPPDVPFAILDSYPNARSIKYFLMLRDPTKRAVSAWKFHSVSSMVPALVREKRSFKQAVDDGISQRLALEACYTEFLAQESPPASFLEDLPVQLHRKILDICWNREGTHDETTFMPMMNEMHSHVDKGIYIDQVRRWSSLLGGIQNFFIFSLEGWVADPVGSFMNISRFAGFEAVGPNGFNSLAKLASIVDVVWNEGDQDPHGGLFWTPGQVDSYADLVVEPEAVARLEAFYKPYTAELFKFLGRSLW